MKKTYILLIAFYLLILTFTPILFAQEDELGRAKELHEHVIQLYQQGQYEKAIPLAQEALRLREQALGHDHLDVAQSLNNLAELYESIGAYAQAAPLYQRALKIRDAKLPPYHPDVDISLANLADLYQVMGKYDRAEPLFQRILKDVEESSGPDSPNVARFLNKLAFLYESMGSYEQADSLYQRALKIYTKVLGSNPRSVDTTFINLIIHFVSRGEINQTITAAQILTMFKYQYYQNILPYLTEKRQLDFLQKESHFFLLWPSLYLEYGMKYSKFKTLTNETLLNQKGLIYEIMTTRRRHFKSYNNMVVNLLDSLNDIRAQLACAFFIDPSKITNMNSHIRFIQFMQTQQERLEIELAKKGNPSVRYKQPITTSKFRRVLPEDHILVDFWYFPRYIFTGENKGWGNYHYLAVVSQVKGQPEIFHLGEADSINKSIIELRQAIFANTLNKTQTKQTNLAAEQFVKTKGKKLYHQLFKPLLPAMGHNQKVIICADGPLHYLPFGVMVDEQNRYLVEIYLFHYVLSSRDILNWEKKQQPSKHNAIILAKSKFQQNYPKLKYSVAEAIAIDSLLKRNNFSTKLNLEDQATESLLKSVKSTHILHISTQSFFKPAPTEPRPAREIGLASFQKTIRRGLVENPLLRSGLILTGTNQTESNQTGDDGIATALEIAGLDLAETDLVILSASLTGIGDLKSGEGLYGLHRSFLLAGAKTVLASLWSVPDLETKDLMVEFYRRYLSEGNMKKTEALRQAQLAVIKNLREKYGAAPPGYWGAFVCIGEP